MSLYDIEDKDLAMVSLTVLGALLLAYMGKEASELLKLIIVGILALAGDRRSRYK